MISRTRATQLDRQLDHAVADLLAHDDRTVKLAVHVRFDGGVAHVDGSVDNPEDLALLRELLSRIRDVHAVWDRVQVSGREPRVVDLGCGNKKQHPGNIGIDAARYDEVGIIGDIADGIPLATESVDHIYAIHVLEHLPDYVPVIADCHRVLRDGGVLHVMVPWWKHVNAVADPTHRRLFDTQTFKWFCRPPPDQPAWWPLLVGSDEASVFADLSPVKGGQDAPSDERLARFFT